MRTVQEILHYVGDELAPEQMKMEWDNVGLLCGDPAQQVERVLVALDPFEAVCREAAEWGAQLLVTHHPLIFQPARSVTTETGVGRAILELARRGISAINAHTNLDCAPGGVNDCLAAVLGLEQVRVLQPQGLDSQGRPWGLLRAGETEPAPLSCFLRRVKEALHCPGLRYVDGGRPVRVVAVGGGACGDAVRQAIAAGCDTFVTADVKYNQFWDARDLGLNLIDAGHFWTENPVCIFLASSLRQRFPDLTVEISKKHRCCINFC